MITAKRQLTELDIKYISKLLGRDPNENELDFIEYVNSNVLNNRKYLEVLARLNHGANRRKGGQIQIEQDKTLKFFSDLKIYVGKKAIFQGNHSEIEIDTDRINHIRNNYTIISKEPDLKLVDEIAVEVNNSISIQSNSDCNNSKQIIFKSTIGIDNSTGDSFFGNNQNYSVYKIEIGKKTKKNQEIFKKLIADNFNNNLFKQIRYINNNDLGFELIRLLKKINYGITFDDIIAIDGLIEQNSGISFLALTEEQNIFQLNKYCDENGLSISKIGGITVEPLIQLISKKDNVINLPLSVFDLQYDKNVKHYEEPVQQKYKSSELVKDASNSSLSNQLIKIFEKLNENNFNIYKGKINIKDYGVFSKTNKLENPLTIVPADSNNLLNIAPRMSGKMSIANAARKMACLGVKPSYVLIHNLFPDQASQYYWKASEILQGQEEAIRELALTIGKRKIDTFENNWQQNVIVVGQRKKKQLTDIAFKSDGDFISLLGSHRGELEGSEYAKYISNKSTNVMPSVDLNMEVRLQDVVQQGVNTKLLKSATNVSSGGISIAIAKSLVASEDGIGAKIHLSRKLSDEELLFGETQGIVIVTLAEEEIMEFERICMTVSVPSTTIGRVTANNTYTFNNSININVDKLRRLLT